MAHPLTDSFWINEQEILMALLEEEIEDAVLAGIAAGMAPLANLPLANVGLNTDLLNTAAEQYARQHTFELVSMINETSRGALQDAFSTWVQSGDPLPSLFEQIEPLFGKVRAELIATTEVTRIYAESNMMAWRQVGIVQGKRWQTAADDLVCEICGPLDGQEVGLDEPFGDGFDGPPGHPRCRCWIQPVVIEPAEETGIL